MNKPQFTILVPSRNRPNLILDTLWSIQRQTFTDFEVFIIDNGDEGQLCKESVAEFLEDPRFNYLRTGGLAMPDNWEFAYEQGSGQYKMVLSDRLLWSTDEFLERLHQLLNTHNAQMASWKYGQLNQAILTNSQRSRLPVVYQSDDVLHKFGAGDHEFYFQTAPRGLNSCVRYDLLDRIKNKFGRFCYPLSPDFTSSYLLLFSEPELLHLDANIIYEADLTDSNGTNARNSIDYCKQAICNQAAIADGESISWEVGAEHVPVKVPGVFNSVFNDLLSMAKIAGYPDYFGSHIDPIAYFMMIRGELDGYAEVGCNVSQELAEWERAVGQQPKDVAQAVREMISSRQRVPTARKDNRSAARKLASRIKQVILSGRSTESSLKSPPAEVKIDIRKAVEEAQHTVFGRLL